MGTAILVGTLGADAIRELIELDILRFVRVKGSLCYIGNGGGLRIFEMASKEGVPRPAWAPIDEAISWALGGLDDNTFDKHELAKQIVTRTSEVDLSPIENEIRHDTYTEIQESETLANWFAVRNTELDRLAGIGPKGVQVFEGYEAKARDSGEIATVLRLAQINLELRLAGLVEADDFNTAAPITDHLAFKLEKLKPAQASATAASKFFEITDVPSVGEAVLAKKVSVESLMRLRHSNDGKAFREWFHEHASEDAAEIARSYIALLNSIPAIQGTAGKSLRWIVSTAIGMIPIVGNVLGPIVGAADTFLADRIQKPSPKFFVEKLTKLLRPQISKSQ
jgi:hypothetical protein